MKKILAIVCCIFVIAACSSDPYKIDPVATAKAPWGKDDIIVNGFCSQTAIGWCTRVFLGITTDGKVLVQDFYTKIRDRIEYGKVYDPRTEEIESKFTDPFTIVTIEDAKMNLFYVDNGKDGAYRVYDRDGELYKKGTFRNGLKHGTWTVYLPNGTGYKETFENGKSMNIQEFGD